MGAASKQKIKIYLETSVVSGYFDANLPDRQKTTREFFSKLQEFEVYISTAVLDEIKMTEEPKRTKISRLVNEFKVLNSEKKEIFELANIYVRNNLVSERYFLDAVHLACATFYKIDVLVSWNFKHMVNFKTKNLVNSLNKRYNYDELEILSPLEL